MLQSGLDIRSEFRRAQWTKGSNFGGTKVLPRALRFATTALQQVAVGAGLPSLSRRAKSSEVTFCPALRPVLAERRKNHPISIPTIVPARVGVSFYPGCSSKLKYPRGNLKRKTKIKRAYDKNSSRFHTRKRDSVMSKTHLLDCLYAASSISIFRAFRTISR